MSDDEDELAYKRDMKYKQWLVRKNLKDKGFEVIFYNYTINIII